ncbi:GNAT family N-acetyltransferase [Paenibacillus sp. MMS20-IR301]|uniref:GNAT family N-acetyltransferase n=1 Tax=Paenibacillus sp. MMS20-IR301 TaxID=2895946 RepID=UPI0028EDF545|nr:GNAT family N-acetyltransferase [Paenibacillus sp. MMS20-IR301]WNS42610.1 GNAT family N-acetyltransferase [Paenibacillus sp. MMS20-IR301]
MIRLVQMDESAFQFFLKQSTRDYAEDKIKAGTWDAETAMQLSKDAMTRFLPKGLYTEGAYLYSVVEAESGAQAGYIWFNMSESRGIREAFIYDFYIFEPFQSKGYGKQALALLDEEARKMNVTRIGLHVFGQNDRAFELYKKMGFTVTDITMSKTL